MESNNEPQGIVNPTNQADPNPAKVFIQWKSKLECFVYWHKQDKKDVEIKLPFTFIPLYRCETVKGYNHKKSKTFIANEVLKLMDSPIVVKSYNGKTKEKKIEHSGMYENLKEDFDQNIKFTVSLYCAVKNKKGELSLVNVQLNGAGVHHWFDFENSNKIWGQAIEVSSFTDEVNGDVKYKAPKFTTKPITPEDNIACGKLQAEISKYLEGYFAKNKNISTEQPKSSQNAQNTANSASNQSGQNPAFTANSNSGINTEKIEDANFGDDDDLPF